MGGMILLSEDAFAAMDLASLSGSYVMHVGDHVLNNSIALAESVSAGCRAVTGLAVAGLAVAGSESAGYRAVAGSESAGYRAVAGLAVEDMAVAGSGSAGYRGMYDGEKAQVSLYQVLPYALAAR